MEFNNIGLSSSTESIGLVLQCQTIEQQQQRLTLGSLWGEHAQGLNDQYIWDKM